MCDIRVSDSIGWRRVTCARDAKHSVIVTIVNTAEQGQRKVAQVCGQHKRMLERGDELVVRNGKDEAWVKGEVTDLGAAEKELKKAEWNLLSAKGDVQHSKGSIGASALARLDNLLVLTDGLDDFKAFRGHLLIAKKRQDAVLEREKELALAEARVEELKKG